MFLLAADEHLNARVLINLGGRAVFRLWHSAVALPSCPAICKNGFDVFLLELDGAGHRGWAIHDRVCGDKYASLEVNSQKNRRDKHVGVDGNFQNSFEFGPVFDLEAVLILGAVFRGFGICEECISKNALPITGRSFENQVKGGIRRIGSKQYSAAAHAKRVRNKPDEGLLIAPSDGVGFPSESHLSPNGRLR